MLRERCDGAVVRLSEGSETGEGRPSRRSSSSSTSSSSTSSTSKACGGPRPRVRGARWLADSRMGILVQKREVFMRLTLTKASAIDWFQSPGDKRIAAVRKQSGYQ